MVFRYYASGNNAQVLYDLNHLQKLTMKGDRLESFHYTWNLVASELCEPPDPKLRQYLYYEQIKNFKPQKISPITNGPRDLSLINI